MKRMINRWTNTLALFVILLVSMSATVYSAERKTTTEIPADSMHSESVNSTLAKLSDEQVRDMLIAELTRKTANANQPGVNVVTIYERIVNWLHLFDADSKELMKSKAAALLTAAAHMPEYLSDVITRLGNKAGFASALFSILSIALAFIGGYLAVLFFKAATPSFHDQAEATEIPRLGYYMRFWAGVIRTVPGVADLAVFTVVTLALFFLTPFIHSDGSRYLFMAALLTILVIRGGALLSHLLCSPTVSTLRLLSITDAAARTVHRLILFILTYVFVGLSSVAIVSELGMPRNGVVVLVVSLGSMLLLLTAAILLANRRVIADYILSAETIDTGSNWVIHQFARLWHIPALLYLLFVWSIFLHHQIMGIIPERQAFLLSLLVLPIFLVVDRIGHWVVESTINVLQIYHEADDGESREGNDGPSAEEKKTLLTVRVFRGVRVAILIALFGWVLHIWGYTLPYVSTVSEVVFRSLVIMTLALLVWRAISAYIEKKLLEGEPDEPVEEDQDSEWGSSVARGRAYTLLPMLRKFIGTVLVVMVSLTVLSTIGIEIGPLLAGAGVIGLAIGFGAQKLVSDIFSGFFFLLDDAFRVGEYLEAGGVSGAVEGISLRNVLLRHHRGMLQIVPYSELGSITNYMRGGIVVKFNLEFPYDTDIDLVRRIIKKIGQAMLEDEDFGKDFIRPVKSQGVREITNSVMVIRVKFTAQPGTHFVIRREAYKRITEALAAKGIYYAHRKVIVELPDDIKTAEAADMKRMAETGAAAGLASESNQNDS